MATPRLDQIAVEFVKRIPDSFKSSFIPGTMAMPDANVLTASEIIEYVNRGLNKYFNIAWAQIGGDSKEKRLNFASLFPELIKRSLDITLPYLVGSENKYLDFYKVFGSTRTSDDLYIRIWESNTLNKVRSKKYFHYTPTNKNPVIIQNNKILEIYPDDLTDKIVKIQYVAAPLDPETGSFLVQNGGADSPFLTHHNSEIVNLVYELYLLDSQQTT